MIRAALLTLTLLLTGPAAALNFASTATENLNWQAPFAGAKSWTAYGVVDDGTTDNTTALNSIPPNTPILGTCPNSGTVHFRGTWAWPNNLLVWQQPNCKLIAESTDITAGHYPISLVTDTTSPTAAPITNVKYYGLDITCSNPTQTLKAIGGWIDHLKLLHFTIRQCGGFIIRGSDREIAFGSIDTTPMLVGGNPGIRDVGNAPLASTSPGMWANVDYHHNYVRSGDGAYQTCQPTNSTTPSIFAGVSTYGILYRDSTVNTLSNMALVNWANATPAFTCQNITYEHINGVAQTFAWVIPGQDGVIAANIRLLNSTLAMTDTSGRQGLLIGNFPATSQPSGAFTGKSLSSVLLSNLTLTANRKLILGIYGCFPGIQILNNRYSRFDTQPGFPITLLTGTCGVTLTNSQFAAAGANGLEIGSSTNPSPAVPDPLSTGDVLTNLTITNVPNTFAGLALKKATSTVVTSGSVSPVPRSTTSNGVSLTTDPNGTHSANVHGVSLTTMPTPVVCALNQTNSVTSNPGAADCPP